MTQEELWALFPIFLVPHKETWEEQYRKEAARLYDLLDEPIVRISHVGSTAINGIYAKDIVDILVELPENGDLLAADKKLEKSGYRTMFVEKDRISLNRGYTKDGFADEVFHLHLRRAGDHDELFFRDYLNDHPDVAAAYEKMKRELETIFRNDRDGYTDAKTEFIRRYTALAKESYPGRYKKTNEILVTDRLILRPWEETDARDCYEYARDPEIGPPCGWQPHKNVEESLLSIRTVLSGPECYAVCLKKDGRAIGDIELKLHGRTDMTDREDECEVGFWLGKPFWGQGVMPEAVESILRRAFEKLGMRAVWCGYYDGNQKSARTQEKCGFVYHHTTEGLSLPLLNEVRVGHANLMTKERWRDRRK